MIETSLPMHDPIGTIIDQEHELIGFHTSTSIETPITIIGKTPNMKPIGTMSQTLLTQPSASAPASSIVPANETIDICSLSSTFSSIDLLSPAKETKPI